MESEKINFTEEYATENQQENKQQNSITENSVLSAIGKLDSMRQGLLLKHFKLGELYQMIATPKDLARCTENYSIMATFYIDLVGALIKLRTQAIKELNGKYEETVVDTMEAVYDGMSDTYKREFCRKMVDRGDFFQDAYKEIMGKMNSVLKGEKEMGE